jgi:hypothetical protein
MTTMTKGRSTTISPRAGNLLTRVAETADLDAALWKVLSDYIDLKIRSLQEEIVAFETKWGMTFAEFSDKCEEGSLATDPYAYEVESDFWAWERAETLLDHYKSLQP